MREKQGLEFPTIWFEERREREWTGFFGLKPLSVFSLFLCLSLSLLCLPFGTFFSLRSLSSSLICNSQEQLQSLPCYLPHCSIFVRPDMVFMLGYRRRKQAPSLKARFQF